MELGTTMTINRFSLLGALLATLVSISSADAAGKFYKWTDDKGVVHYGENPPDTATAQKVNVHTGKASAEAEQAAQDDTATASKSTATPNDVEESKKVADENAKIIKQNCDVYRQNLSALKSSPRIREKDAKGEYRYLTDEEKAAREKDAQSYLDTNCK